MKSDYLRRKELIEQEIRSARLDLSGRKVFTEAAVGEYMMTSVIAALAGAADVWAIARDSSYGSANDAKEETLKFASFCKTNSRIQIITQKTADTLGKANIITNLGFVRPIDSETIGYLSREAVIPLMYSSWEFRQEDLDLSACNSKRIPVMGTDESEKGCGVLGFCGSLISKMLFREGLEIYQNRILILSKDEFGPVLLKYLRSVGAHVMQTRSLKHSRSRVFLGSSDCLIVSDYTSSREIIGRTGEISVADLARIAPRIRIIQFSGLIDAPSIEKAGLRCFPSERLSKNKMARTAAYLGPLPIIKLYVAGLKVGQAMCDAKARGFSGSKFVTYVKSNSPAETLNGAIY
jgi:hypothetical protein